MPALIVIPLDDQTSSEGSSALLEQLNQLSVTMLSFDDDDEEEEEDNVPSNVLQNTGNDNEKFDFWQQWAAHAANVSTKSLFVDKVDDNDDDDEMDHTTIFKKEVQPQRRTAATTSKPSHRRRNNQAMSSSDFETMVLSQLDMFDSEMIL